MDIEASYSFRRISESLTTSGVVRLEGLQALASQGYQVVLSLLPETNEYAVPGERDVVEAQGIEYIYIPVDFKLPTRSDFELFSAAMDRVSTHKVHIHCAANYRVSAFYALYQFSRGRWSADRAMAFIRDIWQPEEHPGWMEFVSEILGASPKHDLTDSDRGVSH